MQRAIYQLFSCGACWLALTAIAMTSSPLSAQVLDYVCEGELRTDKVFDSDGVIVANQRFRVTANVAAGYVKRDPALAAGCFAGRTEVCACEPPIAEKIICRSLGFRPDGTEVSLDFTLRSNDRTLSVMGREFNARSGTLTETHGEMACTRFPAVSSP
jgi:hypothetical protein